MPRLFVAVLPPEEVLDRIAALSRPEIPGLRWTDRHQWHVTLRFLGQVPTVDEVTQALEQLEGARAVEASLGPAVARFGQRVLHVPVTGLEGLAAGVGAATAHLGRPPDRRPFNGHVTLARVANAGRADLRRMTGAPVNGTWIVSELCTVESHVSSAGARYEVRARLPLAPL